MGIMDAITLAVGFCFGAFVWLIDRGVSLMGAHKKSQRGGNNA